MTPLANVDLSPAERRAAVLAGGGMSNLEIADELDVSITSVQHYLQCAYQKLGVDRAGLNWALEALAARQLSPGVAPPHPALAVRAARRAEVDRMVAENWRERSRGLYRVADRCCGWGPT